MGLDPTSRISSAGVGNSYAASLGAKHLWDLGHRDILLVSWKGRVRGNSQAVGRTRKS